MAPESPGNLIALDLECGNSRLECQVDRYDSGRDFLYVSWNAIECPKNYVPISGGVAFVWVPGDGYEHRKYRAWIPDVDGWYQWTDVAQAPSGAMFILTLPPQHVFRFPEGDAQAQSPVDCKATSDGRMALYWWLEPDRFTLRWQMERRESINLEDECRRFRSEARRRNRPAVSPVHIDRPPKEVNAPSAKPPVIAEPPGDTYNFYYIEHAHDITFSQIWTQIEGAVNLPRLAEELAMLRQAMKKEAVGPEQDDAVGAVASAEQSAKAGNGPKALEFLKAAGKWALGVAEEIGVQVAAAAIKGALRV